MNAPAQPPIADHAVLSDQRTAALVARDGTITWMCAPRFDDPPLFGTLLDPRAGSAELRPAAPGADCERSYLEDTNVLQTRWRTADGGVVVVTEALVAIPGLQRFSQLVRRAECEEGEVELRWAVRPRFGWDFATPEIRPVDVGHVLHHGDIEMVLESHGLGEGSIVRDGIAGSATLRAGESGLLSLTFNHEFPLLSSSREDCERRLEITRTFWHAWLAPLRYDGPWAPAVRRSALTIGACVHDETGAVVAAPTTSLPEAEGGSRNWDYRFSWVRDTCFALDVAGRLCMGEFAQATLGWLLRSQARTHPRLNVFFTLDGEPFAPTEEVGAEGWHGSQPVRDGNSAGAQLQLGCFGDLMETAWLFVRDGHHLDASSGRRLAEVADYLCEIWRNRDSGIWELGDKRNYTLSKMQVWSTLHRADDLVGRGELIGGDRERWRETQEEVRAFVEERCVGEDGTYLRDGDGSGELDCALLIAPRTGFLDGSEERFQRTVDRLAEELGAGGGLLYRYTGMREKENAFLPCSFWMVEALARGDRLDEARALMEELLGYANDVGLFSEELRPADRALLGNMPQALTHLALVSGALAVHRDAEQER